MFDFNWSEIGLIVIVALIFIGPKDMPVAIRGISRALKAVRKMAGEFQTHVDDMVREADLGDAREQFRDLRRFDMRGQFMRAIDGDNKLRDSLSSERRDPPAMQGYEPPPVEVPIEDHGLPQAAVPYQVPEPPVAIGAPAILPPLTARRVAEERARQAAPRFVPPPRAIHAGQRVALDTHEGRA